MSDFEKLIDIDLQLEHLKSDQKIENGFKLYLFEALYIIQQFHGSHKFFDLIFTIIEFIQLMAFPVNKIFDETCGNIWTKAIGNFFRLSHLIYFWEKSSFFIIIYIITCLYIIILLSLFSYILIKSKSLKSNSIVKVLVLLLQIQIVLDIPFLRTLFSAFSCENGYVELSYEIKCISGMHIILSTLSIIFVIIYVFLLLLFHLTLYEYGTNTSKLKSAYTSSTDIAFDITKLILITIHQFISDKNKKTLAIITLVLSIILLYQFITIQPYSNSFVIKFYLVLYTFFCWSCVICIISIFIKNSKFKNGVFLLFLGYPFLIIIIYIINMDYSLDKLLSFLTVKINSEYNSLLQIEQFLKLENILYDKSKIWELKLLFSYIINHEGKCTKKNCNLKKFMNIPFRSENFDLLKILILQHAEVLYKEAISKEPYNIKLRINYIIFLFKKMNKKSQVQKELIILNKFKTNLECGFIIYKLQKYINENKNDKETSNNVNYLQTLSYKLILKKIKTEIENIVINYTDFWNILLESDWNNEKNFIKMNKLGKQIKKLNNSLNKNINSLDRWNLLDKNIFKNYIYYLKEILNNTEKADIYNKKIKDIYHENHLYDEINLYELNYEEMAKNEDYKYIIINCSKIDFNKIVNLSCSVCKLFGYTKKELIGKYSDVLFPEILNKYRKIFFQKKIEEYRRNLYKKNIELNSDLWTGDSFGVDKNNFLIIYKAKWTLVPFEGDKIYGIGNIYIENKKIFDNKEEETIFIFTDNNFVIQTFSCNGIKLLNLDPNFDNNFSNMYDYIVEFNESFNYENENEKSNISNRKKAITKKKPTKKEILKKYNIENNSVKVIHWKIKKIEEYNNSKNKKEINNKFFNSYTHDNFNNKIKNKFQRSSYGNFLFEEKNKIGIESTSMMYKSDMTMENFRHMDMFNYRVSIDTNSLNNQTIKNKDQGKLFTLRINEAKLDKYKVGFIFILKPFLDTPDKNDTKKELIDNKENKNNMDISDMTIISFGEDKNNIFNNTPETVKDPFNLSSKNIDLLLLNFDTDKNNQFTFDVNDRTYKQFRYYINSVSLYDNLKEKAITKMADLKRGPQIEESEEEESSEYDNTDDIDDDSVNSKESSKENKDIFFAKTEIRKDTEEINDNLLNDNITKNNRLALNSPKKSITQIFPQNISKGTHETNKKKEEDFYHVNTSKITLYIFNYSSGFVELQKGQQNKISQVTYLLNIEKEKSKNPNSRFLANTRFMKMKKKGIIKKENNEVNIDSNTSLKKKEIYKKLLSKDEKSVIIKMIIKSSMIFIIIVGTGLLNIIIYLKIKYNIYTFFILIQKSEALYKNLLFEIILVKEMLMVNNPYYNNTINNNKTAYYESLSKKIYNYYIENSFILSNLTNCFEILNKQDEENITKNIVELYMIDQLKSGYYGYQYKKYKVLIYSAYQELNSALYHISLLKIKEIYQYNSDVYYFLKNGMSNLLINSEKQAWVLTEKFQENIKSGHNLIIICCCIIFAIYLFCTLFLIRFYSKIIIKKNKYLSIFEKFDNNMIISYLQNCEKFSMILQGKKSNEQTNNNYNNFSSESISENENDNNNNIFSIGKEKENEKKFKYKNNKKEKNIIDKKYIIYLAFLFLFLLFWQIFIYYYYYQKMTLYQNIITYEYYISIYGSNFIFIFISLREYIFDRKTMFYNETVDEYLEYTLNNYYVIFSESSKMKDIYRVYFPNSYQSFLNYLYNGMVCEFIDQYNLNYHEEIGCDEFFYKSSKFGFFTILSTFVEEIRAIKNKIDIYFDIAKNKKFFYNETYVNDPKGKYDQLYKQYENNSGEYKKYNPANILHSNSYKKLLITHLYINQNIYFYLISESLDEFELVFKKYNYINLIINIIFVVVVLIGFIFLWMPFIYFQHKTIIKIKNMFSIIPSNILLNIPNINNLLGIEENK